MPTFTNGEIAAHLSALAQYLTARGENQFKVKAYRRAASTINTLGESIDEAVRAGRNLTAYPGIGHAISRTIQELVQTGSLRQLQVLESQASPQIVELAQYPRLDSRRVLRIYKKLGIHSIAELKQKIAEGEVKDPRVRQALSDSHEMLLYEADKYVPSIQTFLIEQCRVLRAEPVGDYRRRVEVIREIAFLVETDDLAAVTKQLAHLSSGPKLNLIASTPDRWGLDLLLHTGSPAHVSQLGPLNPAPTEVEIYSNLGLPFIPPELREGYDELSHVPPPILERDLRGELHAHSTSSDGVDTIEDMALAARDLGYEYLGMSDHSQSLKIAGGLSEARLREQIRIIDSLNETLSGIRILKSAEVDILADGSLDYPDDLLAELDYTVCSIHSRFGMGKADQTARILRAMDNPYFNILGHTTGRLLLKRPGYDVDIDRIVEHARQRGCFFEINSSPDRLDLSAENARVARQAGIKVAITTDAHSVHDFRYLKYGIDQARRAGLAKESILNHYSWPELKALLSRGGH